MKSTAIITILFGLVKLIYTHPDAQPTFQYITQGAAVLAGLATGFLPYSGGLGGGFAGSPNYGAIPYNGVGGQYYGGPSPYYGGGSPYYGGRGQYYGGGSPYYGGGSPYYGGGSPYYSGGSPYYNGGPPYNG